MYRIREYKYLNMLLWQLNDEIRFKTLHVYEVLALEENLISSRIRKDKNGFWGVAYVGSVLPDYDYTPYWTLPRDISPIITDMSLAGAPESVIAKLVLKNFMWKWYRYTIIKLSHIGKPIRKPTRECVYSLSVS